jgi:hypothetical protein
MAAKLWWLVLGFVATVFLAFPAAMIGYAAGGALIGGVAVLGTLILIQLPIMLFAMRGTSFTFGKPPDDTP